jgi:hypothetical protein
MQCRCSILMVCAVYLVHPCQDSVQTDKPGLLPCHQLFYAHANPSRIPESGSRTGRAGVPGFRPGRARRGKSLNRRSGSFLDCYHLPAGHNAVQVVRPLLHHLATLGEVFREVVGRAHLVAFAVRQLPFYHRMRVPELVQ